MSILSGFFKTKRYRKTTDGYKLESNWTSGNTVELDDGNTVQNNLGAIKGITTSTSVKEEGYAADATTVAALNESLGSINSNLGKFEQLASYTEIHSGTVKGLTDSIKKYKWIVFVLGTSGNDIDGFNIITVPSKFVSYKPNQICGEHKHYGLSEHISNYQIGFLDNNTLKAQYVNNKSDGYLLAVSIYGMN